MTLLGNMPNIGSTNEGYTASLVLNLDGGCDDPGGRRRIEYHETVLLLLAVLVKQ